MYSSLSKVGLSYILISKPATDVWKYHLLEPVRQGSVPGLST